MPGQEKARGQTTILLGSQRRWSQCAGEGDGSQDGEEARRVPRNDAAQIERLRPRLGLLDQKCDQGRGTVAGVGVLAQLDGTTVGRVTSREPTLEDAYVALVSQP